MKRLFVMILAALSLCACNKTGESETFSIVGNWELTAIQSTKSVSIGDVKISVILHFMDDNKFVIEQTVGEGRAKEYTGTYTFDGKTLAGTYSDGSSFGAGSYEVVLSDTQLQLKEKKTDSQIYVYRKI